MFIVFVSFAFTQDEFIYNAAGNRDPFTALVTPDGRYVELQKKEGTAGLSLEGIVFDRHGLSYAIVNGEIVKVSDKVNGYQVLKIEKNKVIFIKEGQTIQVELKEEEH